jgi:hypothetical protein
MEETLLNAWKEVTKTAPGELSPEEAAKRSLADVLVRRDGWLAKAEAALPRLFIRELKPRGIVRPTRDASAYQGWTMVPDDRRDMLSGRPLEPGDAFALDFGEHAVGSFAFSLVATGAVADAPVRLEFTFAEVPLELAEGHVADRTGGSLSMSWLQHETVTIDEVPCEVRLPRRYSFRYVGVEVKAGPRGGRFGFGGATLFAETSADTGKLAPLGAGTPLDSRMDEIACRTLRDCMQTVFEDGPKRDRRLWLGDLRLEALANYATYGNLGLVKRSLYLLAGTCDDDGALFSDAYERPVPHCGESRILDYTALFAATIREYLEVSGDRDTAEDIWPLCVRQLDFLLAEIDNDGVFRDGGRWWCFIDWEKSLNRQTAEQGALAHGFRETIRLGEALGRVKEVAFLADVLRRMRDGAERALWNGDRGLYLCERGGQASWMGQAWMVLGGLAEGERAKRCLEAAMADAAAIRPVTPYANHYFVEALLAAGLHAEAKAHLERYWGRMAALGADTFWEVFVDGDPLASPYASPHLNSYCHAWSCAPSFFLRGGFLDATQTSPVQEGCRELEKQR